jgi:uncharacterized protein (TIGR02118 family)
MIKVSVYYPNTSEGHFDLDYYQHKHVPMVLERCAGAIKRGEIEVGIAGGEPGSQPPFRIAAHLLFDSLESMQGSFGRHLPAIVADVPNYTNIEPTVQISEVLA